MNGIQICGGAISAVELYLPGGKGGGTLFSLHFKLFFPKIGDNYKALMVRVNGSSTQRDQRLLEVTCCRKNVDPKYFVLATTLSLWIDVYPSVQFVWENITGRVVYDRFIVSTVFYSLLKVFVFD